MKNENFSRQVFFYDFLTPSTPFLAFLPTEIPPPASYRYPLDIRSVSARYPLQKRKTYRKGISCGLEYGGGKGGATELYLLIKC